MARRIVFVFCLFCLFVAVLLLVHYLQKTKLPPEVNRIVNLPFKISGEELYDIFGRYGPIRQIRLGNTPETRGKAFVVYDDIFDAKNAVEHLSGFNVRDRYIIVLYHKMEKEAEKAQSDLGKRKAELEKLKKQHGVS